MNHINEEQLAVFKRAKAKGNAYNDALEIAGIAMSDVIQELELHRIRAEKAKREYDDLREVLEDN